MRIRLLHSFFYPDHSAVSQILSDLAFYLARCGHKVDAIASRGHYAGGGTLLARRQQVEGVSIRRIWSPSLGRGSMLGRLGDLASFVCGSFFVALTSPRCDRVVVATNPPLYAAVGTVLRLVRGERYIYVVMDLFPDVAVKAGLIRPGSLRERLLRKITKITMKRAQKVVVLGTCMAAAVAAYGVPKENIVIIRNWADENAVTPLPREANPLRRELGLDGKFVVMYSGNMGVGHYFEDILQAALDLRGRDDIAFLFIGGGAREGQLAQFIKTHNLTNVQLMRPLPREKLGHSLTLGDAHFVTLREGFEGLIVPSKTYGIMAAGRPVIYQGGADGEIARMLRDEGGGVVIAQDDAPALTSLIKAWADNPATADDIGRRAREVFEAKYTMQAGLQQYEQLFEGHA